MLKLTFIPASLLLFSCSSGSLIDIVAPQDHPNAKVDATSGSTTAGLYDISTFDVYSENGIIQILAGGKLAKSEKSVTLRYLYLNSSAHDWGKPVTLGNNLPTAIAVRGNDIQLAASGKHRLALWQAKGELPGMGPLVAAYSNDDGKTWETASNPAVNNQGDQSHADIIADHQGRFHAVWLEDPEENGYQSLRYANFDPGIMQWSKPKTLDDSTCSCCWNTLALSADNAVNILYRDMKPRDMSLLTSYNAGKSWQKIGRVGEFDWHFDGCPHVGGGLTSNLNSSSHLHAVVWTGESTKAGLYYLNSVNNGKTWTTPQKMGNTAIHADIAASSDKNIAVVWDEMKPEGSSIYFSTSEDGGKHWKSAQQISSDDVSGSHPRLVALKDSYVAFWTEKPTKQPNQLAWRIIKNQ